MIKIVFYFSYTVCTTVFFLYLLFPAAGIQRHLASSVESRWPGIRLSIAQVRPTVPIGVRVSSGMLSFHEEPLVRADGIRIHPELFSFFLPKKQMRFSGNAAGGRFSGTIEYIQDSFPRHLEVDAGVAGMEVGDLPFFQFLTARRISGRCDGQIRYKDDSDGGNLAAQMKLSGCKMMLDAPAVDIDALSFQQVLAELIFQGRRLEIKETVFKGPQLEGRLSGFISIEKPVGKSDLRLVGTVKPHHGFLAALKNSDSMRLLSQKSSGKPDMDFKIEGTIENPAFSFTGDSAW